MHTNHEIRHAVLQHHLAEGNDDFPLRGEFHCIGKKIDNHLTDAQLIPTDIIRSNAFKIDLVANAATVQIFRKHIIQAAAQRTQAEHALLQLNPANLDTGHIQNIVNQRKQMIGKLIRLCKVLHSGTVRLQLIFRQRQHTDNPFHRRTNFMRHAGKEGCFGAAFLLQSFQTLFVACNLPIKLCDAAKAE